MFRFLILLLSIPLFGGEKIKIGCIIPLTGPKAKFGEMDRNAYELALEEIKTPIELIFEDDQGKPKVAMAAAEKLITKDKVLMIIGEYSSSCAFAVARVCELYQVPFLNICGAADKITQQGWRNVFRMNPTASQYPSGFKDFLKEVGKPRSIAIVFENTLFGTSSAQSLKRWCQREGIRVVAYEPYEAGGVDFKPILTKLKAKRPEIIYMISYLMDAILLMRQAKELNLTPKAFVGGGAGFTMPSFLEGAGDACEYVISVTLWSPEAGYPKAKEFYNKYHQRYGSYPDYHGAEAYASLFIVEDAIRRAKELSRDGIREALKQTDLLTPFGPVRFEDYENYTNQNRMKTLLLQVQDGRFRLIWPKEIATNKYIYPFPGWNRD
ncbi:ABC transporter substrate-binding protein [candidate division WOR-3 bacterium]|uniref:ABC transporter substrate-binding protein n=1 Tax=candidate division WOR-3 bacterium TaxID=2052148 RepID=A0A660SEL9_UNCW3|nr:MAG: ABC transporter substrate-binding protein [candidate division WOR-3 bacterium]